MLPQSDILGATFRFDTDRFDYTSELPADANAGNRFYGRDVANFLCEKLTTGYLPSAAIEEDWGWLVVGHGSKRADEFEIAVYNESEHGEGGRVGAPVWKLAVRAFVKQRWLCFSWRKEVPVPGDVLWPIWHALNGEGVTSQVARTCDA